MKNICKTLLVAVAFLAISNVKAQTKKTVSEEVQVTGVCKMCKERIEDAALGIKGVKMATWKPSTQKLKVYFNTKKTDLVKIQEGIAKVGHDTEAVKAKDEDYKQLPDCCLYRDGVEVH